MKRLVERFLPDETEIYDDYSEEDFHMRESDWAIVGKLSVAAVILFVAMRIVFTLAGIG